MDREAYIKSVNATIERCKNTLVKKNQEYATTSDPLNNFKEGAKMSGMTEEQVLFMYCLKHLVSVRDIVFGTVPGGKEVIREKTGDIINYMVLLNAIVDGENENEVSTKEN